MGFFTTHGSIAKCVSTAARHLGVDKPPVCRAVLRKSLPIPSQCTRQTYNPNVRQHCPHNLCGHHGKITPDVVDLKISHESSRFVQEMPAHEGTDLHVEVGVATKIFGNAIAAATHSSSLARLPVVEKFQVYRRQRQKNIRT